MLGEQEVIGWDNLLRGKFSTEWRRLQREYEVLQEMKKKSLQSNNKSDSDASDEEPDENNDDPNHNTTQKQKTTNKKKKKKKKKKKTDRFQVLIQIFFRSAGETMWKQRNKDWHQPGGNKTNLSATTKVDRDVQGLYRMMEQVRVDDCAEFFKILT